MAQQRAPFRTPTTADVAATFPGRWSLGQKDRWDAEDAELFMDRMTVTGRGPNLDRHWAERGIEGFTFALSQRAICCVH
ncbi:unnamed protein product, partial [Durusdinium trenchii]